MSGRAQRNGKRAFDRVAGSDGFIEQLPRVRTEINYRGAALASEERNQGDRLLSRRKDCHDMPIV
jgi:hypothetical protein